MIPQIWPTDPREIESRLERRDEVDYQIITRTALENSTDSAYTALRASPG
jgi:hypothetical protein